MTKPNQIALTAQAIIDAVPDNGKYSVLRSLIGSISCSIIGTASTLVGLIEKKGIDFVECDARDILHLIEEPDYRFDRLHNVRKLMRVRGNLITQLISVSNDETVGSWDGTFELMTSPGASRIDDARLLAALAVCDMDDETSQLLLAASKAGEAIERQRSAELISKRQGAIQWVIEKIFNSVEYYDASGAPANDMEYDDDIECLSRETVERLYDKLTKSVSAARNRAVQRFALGDNRYSLEDIMSYSSVIKACANLHAHYEEANV